MQFLNRELDGGGVGRKEKSQTNKPMEKIILF